MAPWVIIKAPKVSHFALLSQTRLLRVGVAGFSLPALAAAEMFGRVWGFWGSGFGSFRGLGVWGLYIPKNPPKSAIILGVFILRTHRTLWPFPPQTHHNPKLENPKPKTPERKPKPT